MKLLFFISSLRGGGAERVMATLCNELVERRHEVYLVTNKKTPFVYQIDKRIKLLELYPEKHLESNKISRYVKYYKRINSIVKQISPDLIVSFNYGLNVHVILATLRLNIPVIASEHNTFDKSHSLFAYVSRFYLNRLARKVVILTQYDFNFLGKRLPSKVVIPNPLSYPLYYEKGDRRKNILAAGSLDRWKHKGFDNLIKVWAKLSKKYPDWKLEIAGTGNKENTNFLKYLTKQNGIEDNVIFLGFQKEMDKLLQETSIYVLSSRWEGLPMVLLEAMSQGCACISFNCKSGPSEIINHNDSGLLVEDQSLEEMENALVLLIENKKLREKFSKNALREMGFFMPNKIVDRWEGIFNECR